MVWWHVDLNSMTVSMYMYEVLSYSFRMAAWLCMPNHYFPLQGTLSAQKYTDRVCVIILETRYRLLAAIAHNARKSDRSKVMFMQQVNIACKCTKRFNLFLLKQNVLFSTFLHFSLRDSDMENALAVPPLSTGMNSVYNTWNVGFLVFTRKFSWRLP